MKSPCSSASYYYLILCSFLCHITKNHEVQSFTTTSNFMISKSQSPGAMGGRRHSHQTLSPPSKLHLLPELSSAISLPSLMLEEPFLTIANSYSSALQEQPFITKACTGFFLCGSGDVLAQLRAKTQEFDTGRLLRFAFKGFFGTLLWAEWYDLSDVLIQEETFSSALQSMGIVNPPEVSVNMARTVALILAEQFITCPLIYGLWEIPVSTILNGASPSKIPNEVQSKMVPMLIDNAKIWTWANFVIYNVPLQYRAICGNIMDILWQSIVSDYAADCGKEEERRNVVLLE
jgi:hypothetical protein